MEAKEERRSQLGLTNFADFIFHSLSHCSKLSWLVRYLSLLYALNKIFVLT